MRVGPNVASYLGLLLSQRVTAQQIWDVVRIYRTVHMTRGSHDREQWQTTWDKTSLLKYTNLGSSPINFVTPTVIGQADIVVDDDQEYQPIYGFGGEPVIPSCRMPRLNAMKWYQGRSVRYLYCSSNNLSELWVLLTADSAALTLNNLKVCRACLHTVTI